MTLTNKGKQIGEVKEVQDKGKSLKKAEQGDKVALSMPDVVFGKHVKEGDELEVLLRNHDKEALEKLKHRLRGDELELLGG